MKRFFLAFTLLVAPLAAADYYPASARIAPSWEPGVISGVVGGIPTRSGGNIISVTTYGWSSGASAATNSAAFNSAVAASASGDIISIPAGTFATNGLAISFAILGATYNNRTVRGAGMDATILQHSEGSVGFILGDDPDAANPGNPLTTVTAMTRGSANITVADGAAVWSSGRILARIYLNNEVVTPVVSVFNYDAIRNPTVCIIGRAGNVLTLSQPLPSAYAAALAAGTATIKWTNSDDRRKALGVGLEDLTIDGVNSTIQASTSVMRMAEGCWFKNVKIVNPDNYSIFQYDTTNCELRHCYIDSVSGGSNRAGLLIVNSSYALIEDNIFTNGSPDIEANFATTNCVFAYNYATVVNGNHGPHNSYNLWEGNSMWYYNVDGYFGSVSEETLARNWMRSGLVGALKRFTRNFNFIGNLIGTVGTTYTTDYTENWGNPNIGNENSSGTASLIGTSGAAAWADWDSGNGRPLVLSGTLTTRTSDSAGVITLSSGGGALLAASNAANGDVIRSGAGHGQFTVTNITGEVVTFTTGSHTTVSQGSAVTILPGAPGFQQKDLDVTATAIRKANWYVLTGNIPAGESLGGDTLPASYFRATKPSYFGDRPWPPYDSAAPGTPANTNIPAGYRYVNGNENYLGGGSATATATNTTVTGTLTLP